MNIHQHQSGHESAVYTGHQVLDEHGDKLGTVTDVVYDDPSGVDVAVNPEPSWLVVDPGILRAPHYVPVEGSYRSQQHDIVVPWDKAWVKSAPKASGTHVLTATDRNELATHYQTAN